MDTRIALKPQTRLTLTGREGSRLCLEIQNEIGRGGSCIAYEAAYTDNTGKRRRVRLKECFPAGLRIHRTGGRLCTESGSETEFQNRKKLFQRAYACGSSLFETENLTNSITNPLDIYEANNTVYAVSAYMQGRTLSEYRPASMREAVTIVKSAAAAIGKIHRGGFLYLDLKPGNLFILPETKELVQFFDFDSLFPVDAAGRLAAESDELLYTRGFSAPELAEGNRGRIGFSTDVYGVGALLYVLLFGCTPGASEGEADGTYDFSACVYGDETYQDGLFFALTVFFHSTLAAYAPDRYPEMGSVVRELSALEKLSDQTIPYVNSARLPEPVLFVGRDRELRKLHTMLSGGKPLCVLAGMGGIGKSTLVRKFLAQYGGEYDKVFYLYFHDNLADTLADDRQLSVNTVQKNEAESREDYFLRKWNRLKSLTADKKVLLIIDNFEGEFSAELREFLQCGWTVLLCTRNIQKRDVPCLRLGPLEKETQLVTLFEKNLGRCLWEEERPDVKRLISLTEGHTLLLELLAKQAANSYLTISEELKLVHQYGFSGVASEKVRYARDGRTGFLPVKSILAALFDAERMEEEKRELLRALSLFPQDGISPVILRVLSGFMTLDGVNELKDEGWISMEKDSLILHPLIRESVLSWPWTPGQSRIAEIIMEHILDLLARDRTEEDVPLEVYDPVKTLEKVKRTENCRILRSDRRGKGIRVTYHSVQEERQRLDSSACEVLLYWARSVLESCREDAAFHSGTALRLRFFMMIALQREYEDYVLENASALMAEAGCKNGYAKMKLYILQTEIYDDRGDFEKAEKLLQEAKAFAGREKENYIWALYYSVCGDYYDYRLAAEYSSDSQNPNNRKLMECLAKEIHYLKKSDVPGVWFPLCKAYLGKATMLIRNMPPRKSEARRILSETRKMIAENAGKISESRNYFYMVRAWYYALVENKSAEAVHSILKAMKEALQSSPTRLDYIDNVLLPAANIMFELKEYGKTEIFFQDAFEICDSSLEMLPYLKKKLELTRCRMDVCYAKGDYAEARRMLKYLDETNRKYRTSGLEVYVPQEIREAICAGED